MEEKCPFCGSEYYYPSPYDQDKANEYFRKCCDCGGVYKVRYRLVLDKVTPIRSGR